MIVLLSSVLLLGGVGFYLRHIFQRIEPPVATDTAELQANDAVQTLLSEYNNNEKQKQNTNVMLEVVDRLTNEEKNIVKEVFLTGKDFSWLAVGGDGTIPKTEEKENNNDDSLQERHRRVTFYMVECFLQFVERYGTTIVARDAETGRYLGSIGLLPPYPSESRYNTHFLRTVVPSGRPVPTTLGEDDVAIRFEAFSNVPREHWNIMKDIGHMHVPTLAVAPEAQGRGVGTLLVHVAQALAVSYKDQNALQQQPQQPTAAALYLECHDDNVSFYRDKCRFFVAKRFELVPKYNKNNDNSSDDNEDSSSSSSKDKASTSSSSQTTFHYNAMVWTPTGAPQSLDSNDK